MNASRPLAFAVVAFTLVACRIGETNHETIENAVQEVSATKTCSGAFAKPDLATLEPCGDGKGHCYDEKKTALVGLPACADAGKVCVPDKVLTAGGTKLKSCKFFIGDKPGACLSTLVGEISANANMLKQDACDEDERCTPCTDPRDGTDTHTCDDNGVYENDCQGGKGSKLPLCCHGQGLCMTEEGVPEDQRDSLSRDTCKSGRVCAPASLVTNKPETCSALGLSGVCIDLCFAKMLGPSAPVMRGGCGATSVCLPCVIGSGQGMPGCE